jgi:hypothetical protein
MEGIKIIKLRIIKKRYERVLLLPASFRIFARLFLMISIESI